MAIFKDITVRGKLKEDGDKLYLEGKNSDGAKVKVNFTGKNAKENLQKILLDGLKKSFSAKARTNYNLSPEERKSYKNGEKAQEKLEEIMKGKDVNFLLNSSAGFYNKDQKAFILKTEPKTIKTKAGHNFNNIKISNFNNKVPIDMKIKYRTKEGYIKTARASDIDEIDAYNSMFVASPVKAFTSNEDIDYLFDINKNAVEFKSKMLKDRGIEPVVNDNVKPQLNLFTQKSILRHLGGERGMIKKVFDKAKDNFSIPLKVRGKDVNITKDNLKDYQKDRAVLNGCAKYIMNTKTIENSYEKLFALLGVKDENAIKEAQQVDEYNNVIQKMKEPMSVEDYLKEAEKLKEMIKRDGFENSPVQIETVVSMLDSKKKLDKDPEYKKDFENGVKALLQKMKQSIDDYITSQIKIYRNSKSDYGKKIYEAISQRVNLTDEGLKYIANENGRTILNYLPLEVKGQVPMLKSDDFPPIVLKGAIGNQLLFSGLGNREIEPDIKKIMYELSIPSSISKKEQEELRKKRMQKVTIEVEVEPTDIEIDKKVEKDEVIDAEIIEDKEEEEVVAVKPEVAENIKNEEEDLLKEIENEVGVDNLIETPAPKAARAEKKVIPTI